MRETSEKKFKGKSVRFLAAAALSAALIGSQVPIMTVSGSNVVSDSRPVLEDLFPDNITVTDPVALYEVGLPERDNGKLEWLDDSITLTERVQSCEVLFVPNEGEDFTYLEEWDEELGGVLSHIHVVVSSLAGDDLDAILAELEEADCEDSEGVTVDASREEVDTEESTDAENTDKDDASDDEENTEGENSGKEESTDGDKSDAEGAADDDENTSDSKDTDKDGNGNNDGSDSSNNSNKDAEKDAADSSNKEEENASDSNDKGDSSDSDKNNISDNSGEDDNAASGDEGKNDQAGSEGTDSNDKDNGNGDENDASDNTDNDSTDVTDDEKGDEGTEDDTDDSNIFDNPTDFDKEDDRPIELPQNPTEEEKIQQSIINHMDEGISVSGIDLPWYVQFRVTSGENYEFTNESDAMIFQSYEFELWDLQNNTEYEIPDGEYVSVTIPVKEGYDYTIEHLLDNGAIETIIPSVEGGIMVFSTHSFSPFGIAGSKQLVGPDFPIDDQVKPSVTPTPTVKPGSAGNGSNDGTGNNGGTGSNGTTGAGNTGTGNSTGSASLESGNNGSRNEVTGGNGTVGANGDGNGAYSDGGTGNGSGSSTGTNNGDGIFTNNGQSANGTHAVDTGDTTAILPFVILVIAAAVLIGAVIFLKKKKK